MGRYAWWKPFVGFFRYWVFAGQLIAKRPHLVLIPNGQTTGAFLKDSVYIVLARLLGAKVLIQLRGSNWLTWLSQSGNLNRWFVKRVLRLTSGAIVLGDNLRYLFRENFPEHRIFVVPNGANFEFPKRLFVVPETYQLLFFSNLFPTKGVEDVLEAYQILHQKGISNVHLTLAGQWKSKAFEEQCLEYIERHNLKVTILRPTSGSEKINLFAKAHIFVFPPRIPEGHPWVVVESMAAGLPVIATDQGSIIQSVHNGYNGYIVDTQNPTQIASRLYELITKPELLEYLGNNSRILYEKNFTEQIMISKLSAAIYGVLNL